MSKEFDKYKKKLNKKIWTNQIVRKYKTTSLVDISY